MKKIILILVFILIITNVYSGDNSPKKILLPEGFYDKIFGVWDEEFLKDANGSMKLFSWGTGEYLKNSSVQIDYDLYQRNRALDLQGLTLYEVISVNEIDNDIYKIELYDDYEERTGVVIIHWIRNNVIWFESEQQYEYSLGLIPEPDISYGETAYYKGDVLTGPDNLYYRRSGPGM